MTKYTAIKNAFKVIYAPHKAFKEIIQDPKYIGPILIMIFFIAADTGFAYTLFSKQYFEQTLPAAQQLDKDIWTENYTLWTVPEGVVCEENSNDYINGSENYYGTKSIQFSINDSNQIWMQLNNIGTVNCSELDGYQSLYLRIKWTSPGRSPKNVTIFLFSSTPSIYFYYNLTENFINATVNIWNNLAILLRENWLKNSDIASWDNITGIKLDFTWHESSNITLLIDGLFFGGIFKPSLTGIGDILNFSLSAFTQFVINWIILGGLLYIMVKAFGAKILWRPVLILVGFALITMFIQAAINAITFSTLPTLRYGFDLLGGVNGEREDAIAKLLEDIWLVNQIYGYVQIAVYIWTMGLCAIATQSLTQFSWTKSFFIGALAYFASIFLISMIFGI
ncbi:MAG: Yip1 family protein [Candidatus Bathycorpusculaceae bacterium]